jgi:branched-chain amino acid transport system permease protein
MANFAQLFINGLFMGSIYALAGCSIVLIFKATRVFSIAHGALMAIGALLFWYLFNGFGLPFWLAFLIAVMLIGIVAGVAERLFMRPLIGQPPFSAFFMTFGLFMMFEALYVTGIGGVSRAYVGLVSNHAFHIGDVAIYSDRFSVFGVSLLVFILIWLFFRYTDIGLRMRATSENHQLAQSTGVNVRQVFSLVWIGSGVIATVAGIAAATVTDVSEGIIIFIITRAMTAALVGGLESFAGALLAGLLLGVAESISSGYIDQLVGGGFADVAAYLILLLVLIIRPYGMFGEARIERV